MMRLWICGSHFLLLSVGGAIEVMADAREVFVVMHRSLGRSALRYGVGYAQRGRCAAVSPT